MKKDDFDKEYEATKKLVDRAFIVIFIMMVVIVIFGILVLLGIIPFNYEYTYTVKVGK